MTQFDKLPFEIQERMLEEQVKQGNPRDLNVFRKNIHAEYKGFSWAEAEDEHSFWMDILLESNLQTFFVKYPRNKSNFKLPENWYVVITEENTEVLSDWRGGKGYIYKPIEAGKIVVMADRKSVV